MIDEFGVGLQADAFDFDGKVFDRFDRPGVGDRGAAGFTDPIDASESFRLGLVEQGEQFRLLCQR